MEINNAQNSLIKHIHAIQLDSCTRAVPYPRPATQTAEGGHGAAWEPAEAVFPRWAAGGAVGGGGAAVSCVEETDNADGG